MSAKDLSSEVLGEMDTEADVAASALSDLANAESMQGLEVMAKAAREAEPHLPFPNKGIIDLVEGDVEVVVTVSKTINATLILDSVYQFDGTKELVGKLNHKSSEGAFC